MQTLDLIYVIQINNIYICDKDIFKEIFKKYCKFKKFLIFTNFLENYLTLISIYYFFSFKCYIKLKFKLRVKHYLKACYIH